MELLISRRTHHAPSLSFSPKPPTLEASLQALLRHEGVSDNVEISLVLCDDDFIRQLNAAYRGLDKPTDVLSFAQEDEEPLPGTSADPPRNGEGGAGFLTEGFAGGTNPSATHSPVLPHREDPCEAKNECSKEVGLPRILGDIVISVPTAERQAAKAGWGLESEVVLLAVHGLLHLLGYDDETAAGATEMQNKTAQALSEGGIMLPEGTHPFFVEYE